VKKRERERIILYHVPLEEIHIVFCVGIKCEYIILGVFEFGVLFEIVLVDDRFVTELYLKMHYAKH